MIICSCNMLSDRDVRGVVTGAGAQLLTAGQVYDCLGCGARCGRCARTIKRIMQEAAATRRDSQTSCVRTSTTATEPFSTSATACASTPGSSAGSKIGPALQAPKLLAVIA